MASHNNSHGRNASAGPPMKAAAMRWPIFTRLPVMKVRLIFTSPPASNTLFSAPIAAAASNKPRPQQAAIGQRGTAAEQRRHQQQLPTPPPGRQAAAKQRGNGHTGHKGRQQAGRQPGNLPRLGQPDAQPGGIAAHEAEEQPPDAMKPTAST
jgi:hypothetical protein